MSEHDRQMFSKILGKYGLLIAGGMFYVATNCWFGWNKDPACTAEEICDFIFRLIIIIWGIRWVVKEIASQVVNEIKSIAGSIK